jgi:hypothetical protein
VRFKAAPKPIVIGYVNAHQAATTDDVTRSRQVLVDFAEERGFHLGDVLVEQDPSRPLAAFLALIKLAIGARATAVAIPAATDFGPSPRVQTWMRDRLEHEAKVAVHVAWGPQIGSTADPEPAGALVDGTRYTVDLRTMSGRAVEVTFRFRRDFVEIWHKGRCRGVPDRERLRAWLAQPGGLEPFSSDDVRISHDEGGVGLMMPGLSVYPLPGDVLAELRRRT